MKEWYLIGNNTKPNMLGGFENQAFLDYKDDAFAEALETDIASTVLLCNSDLSIKKEIRCIIQGNVADTQLQSIQRKGLFTRGTVKDGMYVFFENAYWLIIGFPGNNGVYQKATMTLCQFQLRWQNSDGEIIERWAYAEDFTKYSNGLAGNYTLTVGDNQYGLILPIDNETKKLKRDMRFSIDFDDSDKPDIYKLTNRKVKLNDNNSSGHGGTMIVTMSLDTFNSDVDKKVIMENGREVWVCNYNNYRTPLSPTPSEPVEMTDLTANIKYRGKPVINIGGYAKVFSANFKDKSGKNLSNIVPIWTVTTIDDSVNKYIHYSIKDGKLYINIDYKESLLGSKIRIDLTDENNICSSYIIVQIGGGI